MTHYMELQGGMVIETPFPESWPEAIELSPKDGKAKLVQMHKAALLKEINKGDTIYTVLRSVSATGMSRRIDLYVIKDNKPSFLTGYVASVMGKKMHRNGGIVQKGCGMDMGWHLVGNLSYELFGDESALKHEWI